MKLYELRDQLNELQELAEGGEIPPEALADTREGIEGAFNEKAVSICHILANWGAMQEAVKAEQARLAARAKTLGNQIDSLKNYLRVNMEASGISKIESELFTITLTKPPKIAVVDDQALLPEDIVTPVVTYKIDKRALLSRLKEGPVDGAHMEDGKAGLRIK